MDASACNLKSIAFTIPSALVLNAYQCSFLRSQHGLGIAQDSASTMKGVHMLPYALVFLAFVAIDAVWLSVMSGSFYRNQIGHLMADNVSWAPVVLFYLLYPLGITFFVVNPALANGTALLGVLGSGALLGLFAYGTYDLTNHATLQDWPSLVTIVDLAWGAFLTGLVSVIAVFVSRLL